MLPITIFTPTFNRAYILPKLYESLVDQTFRHFEWVIIDDGSTDGTRSLVDGWIREKKLSISYLQVENGGKYRAINRGTKMARGELFFIVDSDDRLMPRSLERVWDIWQEIRDDRSFCGLAGSLSFPDGSRIGGDFPGHHIDCTALEFRYKYKVNGDLAEVIRTDVIRQFPFPEIEGEKFCSEALIWNRIALHYRMRFLAEPIYITEYLPDGLSANVLRLRYHSPRLAMITSAEMFNLPIPLKERLMNGFIYWRATAGGYARRDRMLSPLSLALWLPGRLMSIYDSFRVRKAEKQRLKRSSGN